MCEFTFKEKLFYLNLNLFNFEYCTCTFNLNKFTQNQKDAKIFIWEKGQNIRHKALTGSFAS